MLIHVICLLILNIRTSIVGCRIDEQGERNFTFMVRPSADLFLQPDDLPAFGPGEWLHLCSIALSAEPSRSTAFLAMEKYVRLAETSVLIPISAAISGRDGS